MNAKGPIFVSLILVLAFVWGYAHENILSFTDELFQSAPDSAVKTPPLPAQSELPPPPIAKTTRPTRSTPRKLYKVQPAKSLATTLDSINPGKIQEVQRARRNTYFEKLSRQLDELQGGEVTPPPALGQGQPQPPVGRPLPRGAPGRPEEILEPEPPLNALDDRDSVPEIEAEELEEEEFLEPEAQEGEDDLDVVIQDLIETQALE